MSSKNYTLFQCDFPISTGRRNFEPIRWLFENTADESVDNVRKIYKDAGDFSSMLKNVHAAGISALRSAIDQSVNLCTEFDIFDIDRDYIIDHYISEFYFLNEISELEDWLKEINAAADQEKAEREYNKATRSRWSGGGFGLSGALKGAAQAAVLNGISGAGYGLANTIGNMSTNHQVRKLMRGKYDNNATMNNLLGALYSDITRLAYVSAKILQSKKGIQMDWESDDDENRAEIIFQNMQKNQSIPTEKRQKLFLDLLKLYPTNKEYYVYGIQNFPDNTAEIYSLSKFFHTNINNEIDKLLTDFVKNLDTSDESHALAAQSQLLAKMDELEISKCSASVALNELLIKYDQEARTFDNHLYDTREQRQKAFDDDASLHQICEPLEEKDKTQCSEFIQQIQNASYDTIVAEKYIHKLQERITQWETSLLDGIVSDLENSEREKCENMLSSIAEADVCEELRSTYTDKVNARILQIEETILNGFVQKIANASEKECLEIQNAIDNAPIRESLKSKGKQAVDKRIDAIHQVEDFNACKKIFLQSDIREPSVREQLITIFSRRCRTSVPTAMKSILDNYTPENISKAQKYGIKRSKKKEGWVGILGKELWMKMTFDENLIHPILTCSPFFPLPPEQLELMVFEPEKMAMYQDQSSSSSVSQIVPEANIQSLSDNSSISSECLATDALSTVPTPINPGEGTKTEENILPVQDVSSTENFDIVTNSNEVSDSNDENISKSQIDTDSQNAQKEDPSEKKSFAQLQLQQNVTAAYVPSKDPNHSPRTKMRYIFAKILLIPIVVILALLNLLLLLCIVLALTGNLSDTNNEKGNTVSQNVAMSDVSSSHQTASSNSESQLATSSPQIESKTESESSLESSQLSTPCNEWVEEDGGWRYYDKTGKYLTAQWVHDGDDNYYVDENGFMLTETWMDTDIGRRYLGSDGKMVVDGWAYPNLAAAYPNQPYYGSPYIRNTVLLTEDWLVMNPTESYAGAECVYFDSNGDFSAVADMTYIEEMLSNYYRSYLISINEQDISNLEYTSDGNRAKMASRISNSSNQKNIYTSYGIWIDWDSVLLAEDAKVYLNAFVEFTIVNRSDGQNEHTSSNYYSFELTTDHYEDDYIVNRIAYPTENEYNCHWVAEFD